MIRRLGAVLAAAALGVGLVAVPASADPTAHNHETNIDFSSGSKDRTGYIAAATIKAGVAYVMAVHCGGAFSVKESGQLTAETHARGGKVTGSVPAVDCGGDNSSMTIRVRQVSDGTNATTVDKSDYVAPADTTAPSTPKDLKAAVDGSKPADVLLTWTASTDNVGVTGYDVAVDGGTPARVTTTDFRHVDGAAKSHSYTVVAVDKAGNKSGEASVAYAPPTTTSAEAVCGGPDLPPCKVELTAAQLAQLTPVPPAPDCLAPADGPTYEAVAAEPTCRVAMDDRQLRLELGGVRWVLVTGLGLCVFLLGWIAVGSRR